MNINDIKKLVDIFKDSDLSELKIREKDKEIKISRGTNLEAVQQVATMPQIMQQPAPPAPIVAEPAVEALEAPVDEGTAVVSPMVGSYYESANPTSQPFVSVGDQVRVGDVLCIIEAMKIMNQIQSEVAGTVAKIAVSNGDPVEYGQTLFLIK